MLQIHYLKFLNVKSFCFFSYFFTIAVVFALPLTLSSSPHYDHFHGCSYFHKIKIDTIFCSGRSASISKSKSLYPVVLIKKHDQDSLDKQANEDEDSLVKQEEEEAKTTTSDDSAESSFEEAVIDNVVKTDKKTEEEEAISAIIKATKAMEETLGVTVTQKAADNAKDVSVPEKTPEKQSTKKNDGNESSDQETNESQHSPTPSLRLKYSSSPMNTPDLNQEKPAANVDIETPDKTNTVPNLDALPDKPTVSVSENVEFNISDKDLADSIKPLPEEDEDVDTESTKEVEKKDSESEHESLESETEAPSPIKPPPEVLAEKVSGSSTLSEAQPSESEEDEESASDTEEKKEAAKQELFVPKISIKLLKPGDASYKQKDGSFKASANTHHVVSITAEPKDKNRSIPELISTDKSLREVQITRVEKLKRKLPDSSLKTNGSASGSSDLSSDSESEQNGTESNSNKKKKKTEKAIQAVKHTRGESEEPMDTDNAQNSPRPSNTDEDSIFPSLFLDPSVTITVVENSNEKKSPTSAEVKAKEICNSVKLSNDVSLTIVEKSKSSEKQTHSASPSPAPSTTAEVSSTSKKPLPPLKGKSKARKSFAPPPKQLISVRNPSSMLANGNGSSPISEPHHLGSTMQKVGCSIYFNII